MRRALGAVAAVLLLSGCGVLAPGATGGSPPVFDSPALRALKASAHIENCPQTSAAPTGDLPKAALPCLGGGRSVALASLRGPMLINVWGTYCGPCRAEMPHLQAFAKKYAGRVQVLGVDYTDTSPMNALGFAKSVGAMYPLVADWTPVIQTAVVPMTILLDANGKIAYKRVQAFDNEEQIEQLVSQYLGVRP